jgi:aminoglycoside phosphotransferase (APT) family kinase protein
MRPEELDAITAALGHPVTRVKILAGGFSHETCLLESAAGRVVARLGGTGPAIEAAVMAAARPHVPVPEVLHVLAAPAALAAPAGEGSAPRPSMVLEYVAGTPLSEVLSSADETDPDGGLAGLGTEVGRVFAGIGAVAFGRPGFFTGADLAVGEMPPWSEQLPEMAETCMTAVPETRLDLAARRAWVGMCAAHAPALTRVEGQARLVHADANPKNVLVSRARGGWRVSAVLDWEFSFSGCPYADFANMTRFGGDYPAAFTGGFRSGFAAGLPADLGGRGPGRVEDWPYLGRVLDMFALSDLVTRPPGHPVADQAAAEIRRWLADGIPDAPA